MNEQNWDGLDAFLDKLGVKDPPKNLSKNNVENSNENYYNINDEINNDVTLKSDEIDLNIKKIELKSNDIELKDNQVYLNTNICGLYIDCEEIKLGDMYIVLILKTEIKNRFELHPGSRFEIVFKTVNGVNTSVNVLFSGILFKHDEKQFMVFHVA